MIAGDRLVDIQGVFARRDKFVRHWNDQFFVNPSLLQKWSVIRGKGSIVAEKRVQVKNVNEQEKVLEARHAVVITTGSEPAIPDIK